MTLALVSQTINNITCGQTKVGLLNKVIDIGPSHCQTEVSVLNQVSDTDINFTNNHHTVVGLLNSEGERHWLQFHKQETTLIMLSGAVSICTVMRVGAHSACLSKELETR